MADPLSPPNAFKSAEDKFKARHQRIGSLSNPFKKSSSKGSPMNLHTGSKDAPDSKSMPSYKKGGTVKKTGMARLHKGEKVTKSKRMSK